MIFPERRWSNAAQSRALFSAAALRCARMPRAPVGSKRCLRPYAAWRPLTRVPMARLACRGACAPRIRICRQGPSHPHLCQIPSRPTAVVQCRCQATCRLARGVTARCYLVSCGTLALRCVLQYFRRKTHVVDGVRRATSQTPHSTVLWFVFCTASRHTWDGGV